MKNFIFVVLVFWFFCLGCFPGGTSICDNISPGESILCDLANDQGVRLEDIGNVFIVINAIAIGEGAYTRDQAVEICQIMRDMLNDPVSYAAFKTELLKQVAQYPGLIEVAMIYLNAFDIDADIYRVDRDILVSWLDKRLEVLRE